MVQISPHDTNLQDPIAKLVEAKRVFLERLWKALNEEKRFRQECIRAKKTLKTLDKKLWWKHWKMAWHHEEVLIALPKSDREEYKKENKCDFEMMRHPRFPDNLVEEDSAVIVATAEVTRQEQLWINARDDVYVNRCVVSKAGKLLRELLQASQVSA